MSKLPNDIRRFVEARINDWAVRDKVLTGYDNASGLFWLAAVDDSGHIDREFAELVTPAGYALLLREIQDLAKRRGGSLDAFLPGAMRNRTMH